MGSLVICCFRPQPGKADDLLKVIREHMPTLRSQDLITDRPAYAMRATDGTIIEVFEWKSEEHTARPKRTPWCWRCGSDSRHAASTSPSAISPRPRVRSPISSRLTFHCRTEPTRRSEPRSERNDRADQG